MSTVNQKVVFISMSDMVGGAENVLLMAACVSKGLTIYLKKARVGRLSIPDGQEVIYATDKSMLTGFLKLVGLLKPYRTGCIIMSTHPYLNAYLGFLKRMGFLRSKLVVRECTSVFTRFTGFKRLSYKLAYQLGYRGADLVVCQTGLMRDQFLQHVAFMPAQKVIIQENPVNLKQIFSKANAPLTDQDTKAGFICAAGRLIPEKGFSVLIHAFSCIEKEYPGLKLIILGEGPERQALTVLIDALDLGNRVILKGRIDNPIPYFKQANACVVSSVKEGFPNVLLEMMSINPIVVSTLCAGGIESIPGILKVEPNNVNALAAVIKTALDEGTTSHKQEIIQQYLHNRTPEIFINSLLQNINYKTYHKQPLN
ncbi:glycosyltransferase [Mucilaginibacter pocheonensis]|uniref:Glycosyltransferase involved in cell wall biosynthesis n=1 Tax=Mucilaginibacter pocheonensis TaxID=398050 RepID=A0ABU1T4D2_9SPHI|nr:glycosyltransferase [Mucilaginibacter pocheonensis]MDR6940223.1 glycosyltransferase involved in cell wall biosynthesis [Mucilaginibacter pocheonensis]